MSRLLLIADPGLLEALRRKLPEAEMPRDKFTERITLRHDFGVRVLDSRFLISAGLTSLRASIIHDFDRWFREALSRVEWRKMEERARGRSTLTWSERITASKEPTPAPQHQKKRSSQPL